MALDPVSAAQEGRANAEALQEAQIIQNGTQDINMQTNMLGSSKTQEVQAFTAFIQGAMSTTAALSEGTKDKNRTAKEAGSLRT